LLTTTQDLQPLCFKCSSTNPLVGPKGNICANCKHEFVYSFYSFDNLPLVEFIPEDGISDEEALKLIARDPPPASSSSHWKEGADVMALEDQTNDTDAFGGLLDQYEVNFQSF
jgi:intraflagellar transport protein 122